MIQYALHRTQYFGERGIIGILERMGEMVCFTLEPPLDRKAHPAIPAGTYGLAWLPSPRLSKIAGKPVFTPRLANVPGRSGILIHGGNTISDTDGCILVGGGWHDMGGTHSIWLDRSRAAKKLVYSLVEQDLTNGGYAEIEVRDAVHSA